MALSPLGNLAHPAECAMRNTVEISPALLERGRVLWEQLVPQYAHGQLPFIRVDADDPDQIASYWDVTESGDEFDDMATGLFFAELLVHRSKTARGNFDPFQMIFVVMLAIAEKGNPGMIERGFLGRIAQLAQAASLN